MEFDEDEGRDSATEGCKAFLRGPDVVDMVEIYRLNVC